MRRAVGPGIPVSATKSVRLKIGRLKIQSSAAIAYCERVH